MAIGGRDGVITAERHHVSPTAEWMAGVEPAPPTTPADRDPDIREQAEWVAAVADVRALLRPRSVAVIGASRRRGTIAGEVLHNLLSFGFQGPVYPVNPNADVVQSVVAYPDIESVPGPVDLAIIVVPARTVLEVVSGCARKGVRVVQVISAGFGETGPEGRARETALRELCRAAGMRLVGPNCMGVFNTDPSVQLHATFAPTQPRRGRVGFLSQSGALGLAIMDHANGLGIGLSSFASVGNKADLSGNDLIRYWEQDQDTDVILLYLESFGNPRNFSRIVRRVSRIKPIVAVKSGRSTAGARAAGSHTGALLAASDVAVDALFRQSGVIRTDTLQEMFAVASLLAAQPVPHGRRVAILTNGGGPGILCADAAAAHGLEIAPLAAATQARLRQVVSPDASVTNPVDLVASATAEQYRSAIEIVGQDPAVDGVVVIFVPPLVTRPEAVARAVVEAAETLDRAKPVVSVFLQSAELPEQLRGPRVTIPSFAFPEDAAIALARVARYGEWLARPEEAAPKFTDLRREEAAVIVAAAAAQGGGWLAPDELWRLLSCYGIPVVEQAVVATAEAAANAATGFGAAVALKAFAPGLVHKRDHGAVQINLEPGEVLAEARAMADRLTAAGFALGGFVVQPMASTGAEMVVGMVHDEQFGPVVACGSGGTLVELLKDVSVRLTPLSRRDAGEMLRDLKTFPLLAGYRGSAALDSSALIDTILRIAAMAEDLPRIAELDLNPVIVHTDGVSVVDARLRVAPVDAGRP